jgi:hypothetical protein
MRCIGVFMGILFSFCIYFFLQVRSSLLQIWGIAYSMRPVCLIVCWCYESLGLRREAVVSVGGGLLAVLLQGRV